MIRLRLALWGVIALGCATGAASCQSPPAVSNEELLQAVQELRAEVAALRRTVERLEQELAIVADRSDVDEELTRLGSHLDQLEALVDGDELSRGRSIEFLLQEMGREVNTIGSKSPDADTDRIVVALKTELERMREQAANVL